MAAWARSEGWFTANAVKQRVSEFTDPTQRDNVSEANRFACRAACHARFSRGGPRFPITRSRGPRAVPLLRGLGWDHARSPDLLAHCRLLRARRGVNLGFRWGLGLVLPLR